MHAYGISLSFNKYLSEDKNLTEKLGGGDFKTFTPFSFRTPITT